MTDVVSLHVAVPEVIDTLERWLHRARSGQLREIALAGVYLGGEGCTTFAGAASTALLGGLTLVQNRIAVALDEASENDE